MRLAGGLLLAAFLTGLAAAPAAGRKAERVPKPGYICVVGEPFDSRIWIRQVLDEQGVQISAEMEWKNDGGTWRPTIRGSWHTSGAEPLVLAEGSAFMHWDIEADFRERRRPKRRLELTAAPRTNSWPRAAFSSGTKVSQPASIAARWSDLAAFARGAEQLVFALRDKRDRIVEQTTVDPAIVTGAEGSIARALDQLAALDADFRSKCEHTDDVDPQIILV